MFMTSLAGIELNRCETEAYEAMESKVALSRNTHLGIFFA